MFEEPSFSSGVLELPPKAVKNYEVTSQAEVFYISQCAPKGLEVKIHKTKFHFSQGDSFTVPPSNLYYIKNTSKSVTASLYFVLVKDSEVAQEEEEE